MEQIKTEWKSVALCLAAGVLAACQIGKAAIAIPTLQRDLALDLVATSTIASAYAVLGAVSATLIGGFVSRFSMHKVLVSSLSLIAIGNFGGALATSLTPLLVSRVVEGLGMICTIISASTLLRGIVSQKDQPIAFTCWAAHIPAGTALMLLVGPWILDFGWRALWAVNGTGAVLLAAIVAIRAFPLQHAAGMTEPPLRGVIKVLKSPVLPLFALAFTLYAIHFYSLSAFLPTLLVERLGLSLTAAGVISALAVAANAAGNIATGIYLRWGVPLWITTTAVFLTILVIGQIVFNSASPTWLVASAAAVSFAVTALLPASIFATLPRMAESAQALAIMFSLILQMAAVGQLSGPIILAAWVKAFGWSGVSSLFLLISLCGLMATWRIKVVMQRR